MANQRYSLSLNASIDPNGIREYYKYYNIDLTTFPFPALIEQAGLIAEKINALLLSKVGEVIVYTEADETFKGRYTIFLVVIDKQTGFLLFFKKSPTVSKGRSLLPWNHCKIFSRT